MKKSPNARVHQHEHPPLPEESHPKGEEQRQPIHEIRDRTTQPEPLPGLVLAEEQDEYLTGIHVPGTAWKDISVSWRPVQLLREAFLPGEIRPLLWATRESRNRAFPTTGTIAESEVYPEQADASPIPRFLFNLQPPQRRASFFGTPQSAHTFARACAHYGITVNPYARIDAPVSEVHPTGPAVQAPHAE